MVYSGVRFFLRAGIGVWLFARSVAVWGGGGHLGRGGGAAVVWGSERWSCGEVADSSR